MAKDSEAFQIVYMKRSPWVQGTCPPALASLPIQSILDVMNRRIPYAVANYEKIVNDHYHFVDKTCFIRELELYEVPVMLRPRRFGKRLWCSILECYYDINRRGRFDTLFGATDIGRAPTATHSSQ